MNNQLISTFMNNNKLKDTDIKYFENMSFGEVVLDKEKNLVIIDIYLLNSIPYSLYRVFLEFLKMYIHENIKVNIKSNLCTLDGNDISQYFGEFTSNDFNGRYFNNSCIRFENDEIRVLFNNETLLNIANNHLNYLLNYFKSKAITYKVITEIKSINNEVKEVELTNRSVNEQKIEVKKTYSRIKKTDYPLIHIRDLADETNNIKFLGTVFKIESIETRTKRLIQTIYVYDEDDALICKRFESKRLSKEEMGEAKTGRTYMIYGSYRYDSFSKEFVFYPENMELQMESKKILDDADEKRIELHTHTKNSEMDGVDIAEDFIDLAFKMGHKGIAITDHMNIQSFPKAQHKVEALLKENPEREFKLLYGVEMNICPKDFTIVRNPNDNKIKDIEYCVFDLETTGFSAYFDHIIEFGGVIIKRGAIIDRLQLFIKPPVSIPEKITELTGITNEMVSTAKPFKESIEQLLEFIGDRVLVAHNASFDYSFLNESLIRSNHEIVSNPVIDTLDMGRALFEKRRQFRLGNLCKMYKVNYDTKIAHRADYDADVLSAVFNLMLKEDITKDCLTLNDLQNKLQKPNGFVKNRANHINVLCKNQDGIKALYELISISNTDRLAVFSSSSKEGSDCIAESRIFKEDIIRLKENLIVSACCSNSEIFKIASDRGDQELKEAMSFYDYIEVQPLENYRYLVGNGSVPNTQRLKDIVKRIIYMAKDLGVTVVATGDAHYTVKEHKIFRDIYINAKGIGGSRHPLYIRNENRRINSTSPDQHLLNTKEMLKAFTWLSDAKMVKELVVDGPKAIFNECEYCKAIKTNELFPPIVEGSEEKLTKICYDTAYQMYGNPLPELVEKRLKRELDSVVGNGYAVIYYISHLLVKQSNEDGYLVGSRGSVGSSFVATTSGITEVNPLIPHYRCPQCKHLEWFDDGSVSSGFDLPAKKCPSCGADMIGDGQEIPFETFLGFKGDKTPDIDLNFSGEYQEKAHLFIREMLGDDFAFKAGTLGTVAEKTAYGYVLGNMEEMGIEVMSSAQKQRLASGCEGVKRTTGQHPGGIVAVPQYMSIYDFTPVQYPANNPNSVWKTTHFEYHEIENNLLKFDILGHVDPTAMRLLQNVSNINPISVPMNDIDTMSIFSSSKALKIINSNYKPKTGAVGLPEFGTRFVRGILEVTLPNKFSDLVRISGLSHGTDVWANNAQDLIEKQNMTLDNVIGCRDDIMSELLHYGLEPLTAFTIMEKVRKGKGLIPEWEESMREHSVPEWYIESCNKIKYMFPKAHAVAYVIMAIRIAWFKVHYPEYYYVSYFSLRCDAYEIETMIKGFDGIRKRMDELQLLINSKEPGVKPTKKDKDIYSMLEVCLEMVARGYKLSNIDINKSLANEYLVKEDDHHIVIPPFTILDGLGENVAKTIVDARKERPFISIQDLQKRTSLSKTLTAKLVALHVLDDIPDTNQISLF
jgi:DNA polymerase-3 subunit alpha (Gram-positive type)